MNNNRTKVITIAALVIAIIGLSIGFAAFSSTLNIQTGANVNPTDTFSVKFSNSDTSLAAPNVLPTNNSTATGDTAVINNNDAHNPVISNLSAHFAAPGEKVEYVFYVRNMGPYNAYLTYVRFNNAESGSSFKKCTATSDNPVSNANAMCEYINFKLELAGLATPLTSSSNFATAVGNNYIVNKSATPESGNTNSKLVKVTIEYPDGSPYADGGFDVDFGSVEMVFSSLAGYVPPIATSESNSWITEGLNSPNVVFDESYSKVSGDGESDPHNIILSYTGEFVTDGENVANVSNFVGAIVGMNYLLVDVDAMTSENLGGLCQLYIFDALGHANFYESFGGTCTYEAMSALPVTSSYSTN